MATTTAKKPARTLSYNRLVGVLTITQGKEEKSYYLDPITRHDFGPSMRCVKLSKLPGTAKDDGPDEYDVCVNLSSREASCECYGHLRHGHKTECRHIAAVRVLAERGSI